MLRRNLIKSISSGAVAALVARREAAAGKPPKSFRELFHVLRETLNPRS